MFDFLFVYSRASGAYPIRFWVRARGQAFDNPPLPLDTMDGVISEPYAEDLLAGLRQRFKEPGYIVERMSASTWDAVAENFPGMYLN